MLNVTAGAGDVHVPLCWQLLDNRRGHANAADRITLLADCVALLGRERIELVVGNRGFIGHTWLKWLQDHQLHFCRAGAQAPPPDPRRRLTAGRSRPGAGPRAGAPLRLRAVRWGLGAGLVKTLAAAEFVFLFAADGLHYREPLYAGCWTIEQYFQNLKGRGFNLEAKCLRCLHKRRKLGAFASLAYAFYVGVGAAARGGRPPITRKNHGQRAVSLSRHSRNLLR